VSAGTSRAVRFVQIVARAQPTFGSALDKTIVNVAREITAELIAEGLGATDLEHLRPPASGSGVPLTRRRT
jgi:hypothetical protein